MGKQQKVLNRKSFMRGRWTRPEKQRFVSAYNKYGNDWLEVARWVKTRKISQVRSHAQKYLKKRLEGYCSDYEQFQESSYDEINNKKILNLNINTDDNQNQIKINSALSVQGLENEEKMYEKSMKIKDRPFERIKFEKDKKKQQQYEQKKIEPQQGTRSGYNIERRKKICEETSVFLQIVAKYQDHFKGGGTFLQLSGLQISKCQNS